MTDEDILFTSDGDVDVEAMREERLTRKVPPNPPPPAAREDWLDGKAIARIAVIGCIDSGSWKTAAVMDYLIDCANRKDGACYPSNATIAAVVNCSEATVERATRFWRRHGYRGQPFLRIAVKGRQRPDGANESNAYHIGWTPLIAYVRDHHYRARVRVQARAILKNSRCDAEGSKADVMLRCHQI
jgi:hypothetical protein